MKNKPLISIILPVSDAERYLKECIKTIKKQSFKNFEVIAVDDASKDRSFPILKGTRKRDKRFRVYQNKNRYGLNVTLNRALRRAKGDYIAFMDPASKNYFHRLKTQLTYLQDNPKIGAVGTQRKIITNSGKILGESDFPKIHDEIQKSLISLESIQPETIMINKTLLPKDLLKFEKDEAYPFLYTHLLMKISNYAQIENLERPLVYIRKHKRDQHLDTKNLERALGVAKFWIKTRLVHEQKPSLKSLFNQLLTPGY